MITNFIKAELNDAIRNLKTKRAPGKDGVCTEVIKHLGAAPREKLLELFNQSYRSRIFPTAWKEATITRVPKKERDPKKKTSLILILISCLGKTLKRMANKRLMWHL